MTEKMEIEIEELPASKKGKQRCRCFVPKCQAVVTEPRFLCKRCRNLVPHQLKRDFASAMSKVQDCSGVVEFVQMKRVVSGLVHQMVNAVLAKRHG